MLKRPSLARLVEDMTQEIIGLLAGENVMLASDARVYAAVFAGVAHSLYGYIDWQARQLFAHSADEDALLIHGNFWLGEERKPAIAAEGTANFTGTANTRIPEGETLRSRTGLEAVTAQAMTTDASGKAAVRCRAKVKGAAGNVRDVFTLTRPVGGINGSVGEMTLSGGSDTEPLETYRLRVLARQAARPLYGKRGDYVIWAKTLPGVTRAWEFQSPKVNRVDVYIVNDAERDITASPEQIKQVQAWLSEHAGLADIVVLSPVLVAFRPKIRVTPATEAVKKEVEKSLAALVLGSSGVGGKLYLSHIREAVSTSAGEFDNTVVWPVEDVQAREGELLIYGGVEWLT